MELANVGLALLPAIASISTILSVKARSNDGMNCSAFTRANGGISNGVVHVASSGLRAEVALAPVRAVMVAVFAVFACFRAGVDLAFLRGMNFNPGRLK